MGADKNIDFDKFPEQRDNVGKSVRVCFHYDTKRTILGKIVRNDKGEPGVMIIQLDSGRFVLDTECQYQFVK